MYSPHTTIADVEENRYADDQFADDGNLDDEMAEICARLFCSIDRGSTAEEESAGNKEPARFNNLPTELKLEIFEETLRSGGGSDFTNAMAVCKLWNNLCTPLVWEDIVIDNNNILPFVRSLNWARESTCGILKSLSLKITPLGYEDEMRFRQHLSRSDFQPHGFIDAEWPAWLIPFPFDDINIDETWNGRQCLHLCLQIFPQLIQDRIHGLRTFSFSLLDASTQTYEPSTDFAIPLPKVTAFIESLPQTCEDLEIDMLGEELAQSPQEIRSFGRSLIGILPRLRHVRLRARYISTFLAHLLVHRSVLPRLETVSLWLTSMRHVFEERDQNASPVDDSRIQHEVMTRLRQDSRKARFPRAKTITIHTRGWVPNQNWAQAMHMPLLHFHFKADITSECTEITPFDTFYIFFPEASEDSDSYLKEEVWCATILSTGEGAHPKYLDGKYFDVLLDSTWVTASNGVRYPAALSKSHGCVKIKPQAAILSLDQVIARVTNHFTHPQVRDDMAEYLKKLDADARRILRPSSWVEGLCGSRYHT